MCVITHAGHAIVWTCCIAMPDGTQQSVFAKCCLRRIRGGQCTSSEAGSSGSDSQPSKSLVSNSTESRFREVGACGCLLLHAMLIAAPSVLQKEAAAAA